LRAMPTRSGGRENDRVGTAHAIELVERSVLLSVRP
jgi:hypothetical protein